MLENKFIILRDITTDLTSFHLFFASSVDSYQSEQEIVQWAL